MNKFIAVGNMTRDPELRYTPKGTAVCNFDIAINRTWKTDDGETHEAVTFINCQAWGRTAEATAQYCKKGKKVLIESRLDQQTWEDKETHKQRSKIVAVVETIQFLGSKESGDRPASDTAPAASRAGTGGGSDTAPEDDDVPF